VASAIDVVVHMSRLRNGRRVIHDVAAVDGLDDGEPAVRDVFRFDGRAGVGGSGRFVATGEIPPVAEVLVDRGAVLPPALLEAREDSPDDGAWALDLGGAA
jgi:pilus assembly protein CpaF